jgi:hypothetical protein
VTSKTTCIARTNRAFVRAVADFAAFFAHRSLHSRAVVSVVALWFERAFAIRALVLRTREAQSAFVGRFAAFAAFLHLRAFVRTVAGFAAFVAHRSLHSRAIVSVVALRFECAFATGALVFWTREAHSEFVGRAAAFVAYMHSRAIVPVVALRLERALAIAALVFRTRDAQSAFVGRAAAFAAFG